MEKKQEFINFLDDMRQSSDLFLTSYYRMGINDLIKFLKSLPNRDASSVSTNEQTKEVCGIGMNPVNCYYRDITKNCTGCKHNKQTG